MKLTLLMAALVALTTANKLAIAGFGDSYALGLELKFPIGERLRIRLLQEHGKDYDFLNLATEQVYLPDVASQQAKGMAGRVPAVVYIIAGGDEFRYADCLYDVDADWCFDTHVDQRTYMHQWSMVLDTLLEIAGFDEMVPIYIIEYIQAVDRTMGCHPTHHLCWGSEKGYENLFKTYEYMTNWTIDAVGEWKSSHGNSRFDQVKLLPMREYGRAHHMMTENPWIHSNMETIDHEFDPKDGMLWHPNRAGSNAIADLILKDMRANRLI